MPAVCHVWLKVNYLIAVVIATASHGKFELATGPVPSRRVRCTTVLLLLGAKLGKAAGSDTSLGMNMDVVELVIYGLLALSAPALLFAAYLLRPLK